MTLELVSSLDRMKAFQDIDQALNRIPFMQDVKAIGDMSLGIVSGYRLLEEIPKYYPNANIKVVASEEAGLLAVEEGSLDVFIGSLYSINLSMERLQLNDLRVNGWISI